jgi:uncharacterized protein (DUF1330 family)
LLTSAALGAVVTFAVMSQIGCAETPPGVIQVAMIDVTDPEAYATQYAAHTQAIIKRHGGRFLGAGGVLRGTKVTTLDGDIASPSTRITVIAWDNIDQLKAERADPEYQALREKAAAGKWATFRAYAIDAVQSTGTAN